MYFGMPQCSILGVGDIGIQAVEYLRDQRLARYQSIRLSPDEVRSRTGLADVSSTELEVQLLHFYTDAQSLDVAGEVAILVVLTDESLASLQEVWDVVQQAKSEQPDILVLVGVLASCTIAKAEVRYAFVESLLAEQVSVILVKPDEQRPDAQTLGQLAVLATNPHVTPGMICIDWEDFRRFMIRGGLGFLGFGEADRAEGEAAEIAAHQALRHVSKLMTVGENQGVDRWALVQAAEADLYDHSVLGDLVEKHIDEGHCCAMCGLQATEQLIGRFLLDTGDVPLLGGRVEASVLVRFW